MTYNTPDLLEKIRAKCVEVNPEIVELKFGCDVIVEGIREDNPGCEKDVVVDDRIVDGRIGLGYFGQVPVSELRIIGRPIRFSDVLLAIEEEVMEVVIREGIARILTYRYAGEDDYAPRLVIDWNLRKDSLEDQSPECIALISSILGV